MADDLANNSQSDGVAQVKVAAEIVTRVKVSEEVLTF
jgi:hypothetical protein